MARVRGGWVRRGVVRCENADAACSSIRTDAREGILSRRARMRTRARKHVRDRTRPHVHKQRAHTRTPAHTHTHTPSRAHTRAPCRRRSARRTSSSRAPTASPPPPSPPPPTPPTNDERIPTASHPRRSAPPPTPASSAPLPQAGGASSGLDPPVPRCSPRCGACVGARPAPPSVRRALHPPSPFLNSSRLAPLVRWSAGPPGSRNMKRHLKRRVMEEACGGRQAVSRQAEMRQAELVTGGHTPIVTGGHADCDGTISRT